VKWLSPDKHIAEETRKWGKVYRRQLKTEVSEAPGPVPHPALHLSFPLVRLGGFAAYYFRGYPAALRAAGLSEARCGGLGEAEARLITIGELDASSLGSGS
jgi:hypothetical protein